MLTLTWTSVSCSPVSDVCGAMHATLRLFTKVAFVLTSPNAQVKEVELKNCEPWM